MASTALPKGMKRPGEGNPIELILVTLITIIAIGYVVVSFSTDNFFWIMPNEFTARPRMIEIYHEGEKINLSPGSSDYEALTAELQHQMGSLAGYYEHGIREDVVTESLERSTIVRFLFDSPLEINTQWNLGTPNELFIPITGANSGDNKVYTGTDGRYGHGALILTDLSGFYSIVQDELGFR